VSADIFNVVGVAEVLLFEVSASNCNSDDFTFLVYDGGAAGVLGPRFGAFILIDHGAFGDFDDNGFEEFLSRFFRAGHLPDGISFCWGL